MWAMFIMHELMPCSCSLGLAIVIVLIGNKSFSGKGFLRSMARRLKFGTTFGALPFGPFGLNAMTCNRGQTSHLGCIHHVCQGGLGSGAQTNQDLQLLCDGHAPRF